MPLDSHSYLVAQGWTGKGTGLRHGAISRPLAIPQKKNLAGLGKDRDEAFPFWDHLFSAAANAIQVKIADDSDEDEDSDANKSATLNPTFKRTSTGILSNRRPAVGTSATTSGSSTPDNLSGPRLSLLATAKRDAARKGLYSKFFRGPVLGPNDVLEGKKDDTETLPSASIEPAMSTKDELKEQKRAEKLEKKAAKAVRKAARAKRREEKTAEKINEAIDGKKRKRDVDAAKNERDTNKKTRKSREESEENLVDEVDPRTKKRSTASPNPDEPAKKKKKKRRETPNES